MLPQKGKEVGVPLSPPHIATAVTTTTERGRERKLGVEL